MVEKPAGATIVKEETKNEAGAKLRQTKRQETFDEFIETMAKAEKENVKPLSGDLEVIKNVNQKELMAFQGRFESGKLNPDGQNRLHGWSARTRTALVLKLAFVAKKEKAKDK